MTEEEFKINDCIVCGHETKKHEYEVIIKDQRIIECRVRCSKPVDYREGIMCNCSASMATTTYKLTELHTEKIG